MAAGILASPGSDYGPCEGECQHRDCAETRAMAAAECVHCDKSIGYGTRFYQVDAVRQSGADWPGTRVLAHAVCELERVEADMAARRAAKA